MKIKNAIIILGPGKSGTTLLNDILSLHRDLFWISNYLNKFPNSKFLAFLNNIQAIDFIEKYTRDKRKYPRSAESFDFFSFYIPNFYNMSTLDSERIVETQNAIRRIGFYQKGHRLIIKLTGPSRLEFLNRVFEDPYIIWMDRNPKAVITSYYKYKWRYKNKPEIFERKSNYELLKEYADYYNWLSTEKEKLKQFQYKKIYYEALVQNPVLFFREICIFLNLNFSDSFCRKIESWSIRKDTNEKHKEIFNKKELKFMDTLFAKN